jgi:flavodoxin I
MKIFITYDSYFGNTEKIAQMIASTLQSGAETTVLRVGDMKLEQLKGIDILIVGSPTRGFRPSDATRAFLKNLPKDSLKGVKVAAFDTRIAPSDISSPILGRLVNFFGYAGKPIAASLTKKGGALIVPPEGFIVKGSEGPLKDGELERAADWAMRIQAA